VAANYFRFSPDQQYSDGEDRYGKFLIKARGVYKNVELSTHYFRCLKTADIVGALRSFTQAAAQNHAGALYHVLNDLAMLMIQVQGAPKGLGEGAKQIRLAVIRGYRKAHVQYGVRLCE
jgi:TPR repeat protein